MLVCTKSFDSFEATKDLCEHQFLFSKKTKIVLFQNGWGNAEAFISIMNGIVEEAYMKQFKLFPCRVCTAHHFRSWWAMPTLLIIVLVFASHYIRNFQRYTG